VVLLLNITGTGFYIVQALEGLFRKFSYHQTVYLFL